MKRCHFCYKYKSFSMFNKRKREKDGFQNTCKKCERAYRLKHPPKKYVKSCLRCNKKYKTTVKKQIFCSAKCSNVYRFTGTDNPMWKGGRCYHTRGYIWKLQKDHPYSNKIGYILEHRLVMEAHLKRHLKPKEVVHHINKNPSDNRIENLMLFKKSGYHRAFHHWGRYDPKNIILDGRLLTINTEE